MAKFTELLATVAVGSVAGQTSLKNVEAEADDIVLAQAGDTHGIKFGEHKSKVTIGMRVACYQDHFAAPVVLTVCNDPKSSKTGWTALKGWSGGVEFKKESPVVVRIMK